METKQRKKPNRESVLFIDIAVLVYIRKVTFFYSKTPTFDLVKRVLVISYYWPPTGGSGVQRWVKFCKYLPQYGWHPVVYTPENPERLATDESLVKEIPSCVEVLRTHITEPYSVYRKLVGGRSENAGEVNPVNAQKKSFKGRLSVWVRGNFFVPDPRVFWVRPSVKYLKKYLSEHPVDAVVTTGPPQSMHLIGRDLKRDLGVRWLADFRDPWTEMFYYKHLKLTKLSDRRHHRLEQSVLDEADGIIAVTPMVRDDFASRTKTPVFLITNGYDEEDINSAEKVEHPGKFVIVHTGLFASDGNPSLLWSVLGKMCSEDAGFKDKLEIRLCGKTDDEIIRSIEEYGLGRNLVNMGYLPHDKVIGEQSGADVLILPLRKEKEYEKVLPGKIFEYMASGRPILGIGQENGAAAQLLKSSGTGEMFDWDNIIGMEQFIKNHRCNPQNIERFSRRRLTEKLSELL